MVSPLKHAFLQSPLVRITALSGLVLLFSLFPRQTYSETYELIRGVIVSTHTDGTDWDSPTMGPTLSDIAEVGGNWVSTHPYGWIRGDGSVRFHEFDPKNPPAYITHPIREAHARGMKILIKPHLGYWGSSFSWRGDISFNSDKAWKRFFRDYEAWITLLAESCKDADGFVVATELDSTLTHEAEWRRIIAEVRKRTTVPLTYAANWTHYREVPFWDALDVIGIQAYFPVSEVENPEMETLSWGWDRILREVEAYGVEQNRKVVFTELGYNRSFTAAATPWAYRSDGPEAEALQARCLEAALHAIEKSPVVLGSFLWKWFPNPHPVGRDFQLATPAIKEAIRRAWISSDTRGEIR